MHSTTLLAPQPAPMSRWGVLHNDFARGLEEMRGRIAAVPNLVVLVKEIEAERQKLERNEGNAVHSHLALGRFLAALRRLAAHVAPADVANAALHVFDAAATVASDVFSELATGFGNIFGPLVVPPWPDNVLP